MKYSFIYSCLLIGLFSFSSCNVKQRLIGIWKVETKGNTKNTVYHFQRNGTLELEVPNQNVNIYNWEFSKKNKSVIISSQNDPDSKHLFVNYLDPFFLGLSATNEALLLARKLRIKSLNHKAACRKLKGEWSLVQLEDSTLMIGEQNLRMTFWSNGIYKEHTGDDTRLGRWVLGDDNSTITLSNNDYTQTIGLHFVQKRKLQLVDEYGSYLMTKTDRVPKAPSTSKIAKRITGSWELKKVGNRLVENSNYTLYLNEDGSLKIFEQKHISKTGQWYVSDDGAFLILNHSYGQESYPIKNINKQKLVLVDEFKSITFQRINELLKIITN